MGVRPGIAAFAAAVLGGIGSISGAAIGGLSLGLLQSLGPSLILTGYAVPSPFQLKDAFTFLVLVLVLIFRPGGILGLARRRRSDGRDPDPAPSSEADSSGGGIRLPRAGGPASPLRRPQPVGEQVTLGRVLLALPPFVAGYVVTRPQGRRRGAPGGDAGPGASPAPPQGW